MTGWSGRKANTPTGGSGGRDNDQTEEFDRKVDNPTGQSCRKVEIPVGGSGRRDNNSTGGGWWEAGNRAGTIGRSYPPHAMMQRATATFTGTSSPAIVTAAEQPKKPGCSRRRHWKRRTLCSWIDGVNQRNVVRSSQCPGYWVRTRS